MKNYWMATTTVKSSLQQTCCNQRSKMAVSHSTFSSKGNFLTIARGIERAQLNANLCNSPPSISKRTIMMCRWPSSWDEKESAEAVWTLCKVSISWDRWLVLAGSTLEESATIRSETLERTTLISKAIHHFCTCKISLGRESWDVRKMASFRQAS